MLKNLNTEDFIVSKTDIKGNITYVNKSFIEMSEYTKEELLGKPHKIIRHKKMPKIVFKILWEKVRKGEEVLAFVLNTTKNNNEYWVFANITASHDRNGKIIGYYSVRRKINSSIIKDVENLYKELINIEQTKGVSGSEKFLLSILKEKGVSYNEFITNIQS
jgi:PAS domain S-box-containing protein